MELGKHLGFDAESRHTRAAQHGLTEASPLVSFNSPKGGRSDVHVEFQLPEGG